jgi:hypothetical protein
MSTSARLVRALTAQLLNQVADAPVAAGLNGRTGTAHPLAGSARGG